MSGRVKWFFWIAVVIGIVAGSPHAEEVHHQFQPEQFERAGRDEYQKPDQVVKSLQLKKGDAVADIGAGSGYFTRRFAHAVNPGGVVYAVDIDENMLRYIQKGALEKEQNNIVTVLCDENDPMLAPDSVNLVFICDTIHHIANRSEYYRKLQRVLRPGGRLAIVDYKKEEQAIGPPMHIRIAREDLIQEITKAGFQKTEEFDFLPYQYFLIFLVRS